MKLNKKFENNLEQYLDSKKVTKIFGKRKEGLYRNGYAAGSYHNSGPSRGYLINKHYVDENIITVFIYNRGVNTLEINFTSLGEIVYHFENYIKTIA